MNMIALHFPRSVYRCCLASMRASVLMNPPPPAPQVFGISAFFQEAKKGGSGGALDGIGAGGGMGFGASGGGAASNRSKIDFEKGKK